MVSIICAMQRTVAFQGRITAPKTSVGIRKPFKHTHIIRGPASSSKLAPLRAAADDIDLSSLPEPDDARGAIAIGIKLTEAKQWEVAQQYFEKSLELPGTGLKRFRDKPPQLSDGERIAAMYNIACCQAQLGEPENIQNGLMAIAGCLEAGYDNFQQLKNDPDLAPLRSNEKFTGLLKRFEGRGGFMGLFKSM